MPDRLTAPPHDAPLHSQTAAADVPHASAGSGPATPLEDPSVVAPPAQSLHPAHPAAADDHETQPNPFRRVVLSERGLDGGNPDGPSLTSDSSFTQLFQSLSEDRETAATSPPRLMPPPNQVSAGYAGRQSPSSFDSIDRSDEAAPRGEFTRLFRALSDEPAPTIDVTASSANTTASAAEREHERQRVQPPNAVPSSRASGHPLADEDDLASLARQRLYDDTRRDPSHFVAPSSAGFTQLLRTLSDEDEPASASRRSAAGSAPVPSPSGAPGEFTRVISGSLLREAQGRSVNHSGVSAEALPEPTETVPSTSPATPLPQAAAAVASAAAAAAVNLRPPVSPYGPGHLPSAAFPGALPHLPQTQLPAHSVQAAGAAPASSLHGWMPALVLVNLLLTVAVLVLVLVLLFKH